MKNIFFKLSYSIYSSKILNHQIFSSVNDVLLHILPSTEYSFDMSLWTVISAVAFVLVLVIALCTFKGQRLYKSFHIEEMEMPKELVRFNYIYILPDLSNTTVPN